jgi:uncharacterized protein
MVVDSHCHIFSDQIVRNTAQRRRMIGELKLGVIGSEVRLSPESLDISAQQNGVDICVILPTAPPHRVMEENDRFMELASTSGRLRTLATLHPLMSGLSNEVRRMFDAGIRGFKFSSFSQRFDPLSGEVFQMLDEIEQLGVKNSIVPVVIFDTFSKADIYYDAHSDHVMRPQKMAILVTRYPGINFVAAHMGGLLAPYDEILRELTPSANLYLDTSNAAHTLISDQFINLLQTHGPNRILFGTDWPWFVHEEELLKIRQLILRAGFHDWDRDAVFGENALRLFQFRIV